MENKNIILGITLFIVAISIKAQETTSTTGGEASGNGGTVSYTVGQIVCSTKIGINGNSIAHGVQQPFEISVIEGIKAAKGIKLSFSAYPNPTTDYLTIKIRNYKTKNLEYQVYDIKGKLLQKILAKDTEQIINMQDYPTASYFIKILDNKKEIKLFKIIKNKR